MSKRKWLVAATAAIIITTLLFVLNREQLAVWSERNAVVMRQAVVTGFLIGGVYGLVALGLTLIFGVLDIINFAHGALLTVGMYLSFTMFERYGIDPYVSILIAMPALFIAGLVIQRLIIHPARHAPASNQLLLTLGLALFLENLMLVAFSATPRSVRLDYGRGLTSIGPIAIDFPIRIWGTTITLPKLAAFVFAVILTVLLYLLLTRTDLGKAIRATAQDKEGARLVGINIDRINMVTFGLGTACVGAAAALVLPFLAVDPLVGNTFNITAFVIVVLGGMGSVPGALLGGLVIGLTQEMGVVFAPSSTKLLGVFVVFILVLMLRPQGLLGGKG
ncbi:MAG: branched-chain amino acid ABC transporter permease [Anaerolineaceae bacterium]|nr:MAG: branched-chain amino acid ABC transporter permease [Anaerolineaceae bacterium]